MGQTKTCMHEYRMQGMLSLNVSMHGEDIVCLMWTDVTDVLV